MRHIDAGYVNFYMNIRLFFLGFTSRPLPSFTSRTRHGRPRCTIFIDSWKNGIQITNPLVNVEDQAFSKKDIFDHQDTFLLLYWKYFPMQHSPNWIYRIAHGHRPHNGWNKGKRLSTNGNNDGDCPTDFKTNGIFTFIYYGKNMSATSSATQKTAPTDSNASHKKFECSKDMSFVQEIITPTRLSLPAHATTIICWRRPTLKQMSLNSASLDHWHSVIDCAKQPNRNYLEWHNPWSTQKAPCLMLTSYPSRPKDLKRPDPSSATCLAGMPS